MRKTKLDRGRERMSVTVVLRVVGILRVLLFAMFMAQPSFAQKQYAYEPPMIDPHATIYVNDGSCSSGKVLKVQGALRNQRRKKSCVPMSDLQAAPRSGAAK